MPTINTARLKRAAFILRIAAESVAHDRRIMFQANLAVDAPTEPHLALWHWATVLREHRGDGHLIALGANEVGPCEAHILRLARTGGQVDSIKPFRGWSDDDWIAAVGELFGRGALDEGGEITADGIALHDSIEALTDRLARRPIERIQTELAELENIMTPLTQADVVPYPNPMGAEEFDAT